MDKLIRVYKANNSVLGLFLLLFSHTLTGQSYESTICNINAGPDQSICSPNCANLTGTYVNSNLPGAGANAYTVGIIPYAPDPFNAGTAIALWDDQWSQVINLPFPFCYYGNTYNQCLIGSNGLITFNLGTAGGFCPWTIPAANAPSAVYGFSNCIMGPWQDLNPGIGGQIRYATYGTAPCRRFVVSWNQVPMFQCAIPLTQQITLYETTNVIDNFIQVRAGCGWNNNRAIQGVMNNGGTQAVVVAGRNALNAGWLANNEGRRYIPNGASNVVVGWYQGITLIQAGANAVVCPTTTTNYTFQATYTNCNGTTVTVSDQMIVTVSSLSVTALPAAQTICAGSTANLNANAVGAVAWQWNIIPGNIFVSNQQNIVVSPTITTTYVVTATDAVGCQGMDTVVVTVSAMNTQDAGPNDTICSGLCALLTATGGVTYQWTANAFLTPPLNTASVNACPTTTTQFYVTVTDAMGCFGIDSVTVFVAPNVLSVASLGTNVTCYGACDGTGSAAASGGYAPYSYAWSNTATGANIAGLCAGQYTVTVTDGVGCTATATISITEPAPLDVQSVSITSANCGQNDGSVTITISGGTPNYIVQWSSGGTGLTESNLPPGPVSVTVTDVNGCDTVIVYNIANTPGATVNISSFSNVTCFGACDGNATAIGTGGTLPYNYSWSTTPAQSLASAANLCPGTYTVTLTDATGCNDTAQLTITEPPQLGLSAGTNATICIGQNANLTAQGSGGTPVYNYVWTDGVSIWPVQNTGVTPTVTTTYSCVVTDQNNCTAAAQSVTITVNPPLAVNAIGAQIVCQNATVNLSALATGGDGNYTYTWTPGSMNGASITVTATQTQQYTVTVTDNCGSPVATDTVSVLVNAAPVPTFTTSGPAEGCEPLCVEFVNTTPNTVAQAWAFGNNLGTSTVNPATFCFNTAGNYDVQLTVTDNIGCTGSITLLNYVTVYPNPVANFVANPNPATILNNNVQYTDLSVGATAWTWSFGSDQNASVMQNPVYVWEDTGTYMVQLIVENIHGCRDSISLPQVIEEDFILFVPNAFTPNGDGVNDLFFPQGVAVDPENYTMYIFDRWGNLIYQTSTWPGGWDGTVQGKGNCQIDTYVYKITTQKTNGTKGLYVGHVSLIK